MNTLKTKRNPLLTALCILTFIGSSTAFIAYFLSSVFFKKSSELIIKYSNWHSVEIISPFYFTLFMAFSAVSLIGAIRMWKLHRDGYYLYLISRILILFTPVVWLGWGSFSVSGAIFAVIFVAGFSMNFKSLT